MSQPTHTRIRMFNTKDTYPNQTLDNDLCQAVRAGNTVYVRGQVGTARGFGSEWPWSSARIGPQRAICSDSERKIIARNPIAVSV